MLRPISFLITVLLVVRMASAGEMLDSIARIRALTSEEAARKVPAAIEATVTFYDPSTNNCLVHDGHDGIFVALADDRATRPDFQAASRLRVEGVTQPGGFLPIIEARRISVLGEAPLPEPRRMDAGELFSPALDCQWVQVSATITGVEDGNARVLVAEISGWTVKLLLGADQRAAERAAALMQQPVTIRGVVGSVFNAQRQLTGRHFFVPSYDQLVPSESALPDGKPRLLAVNELMRSDATSQTRVRVRGTVTHAASDGLYLRGEGGSLFVRAANTSGLARGSRVDAEGFAAVAPFRPVLRATRVTTVDRAAAPQPERLDLSGKNIVEQQAELVTVDADFLARREGPGGAVVLQCRTGKWFFEALLPENAELPSALGASDLVRLTGICEFTTTRPLPFSQSVDGFRLHLRDADDVMTLRRAPWWTLRRLLLALGGVGALALVALAWVALLRRRVAEQTRVIGVQIERSAIKDERQRVARELHDTIEQELAGLSLQLGNARQRLARAPEQADTALELAQRMLRHCREEARTSIRDLRSVALDQRGLAGAFREFLPLIAAECGADLFLDVKGGSGGPTGFVAINLLRITQEAVANAARHASPREIHVRLDCTADVATVEIRDDGRGFDSAAPAPRGHFGVLGIRERANKLSATLTIESAPGAGTTVRVAAPFTRGGNGAVS